MSTRSRIAGFVLVAAACAGCPGTLQDLGRFDDAAAGSDCPDVPQLLVTTCGSTATCHTSTDKQQGLDLQSPDPASRLVGVSSTEGQGLLIDPANPSDSILYTKLTTMPPFGARMPFGKTPLDAATIACVLAWVTAQAEDAGALDGGVTPGTDAPTSTDSASGTDSTAPKDSGGSMDAPADVHHDATSSSISSSSSSTSSTSGSSSSGGSTSSGSSNGGTESSLGSDDGSGDSASE